MSDGAEGLLDRILCVAGAVIFSQMPEFMQQYLQRLEGHLDEARLVLSHFKDVAAQSGMSLDQLVAGASKNSDVAMAKLGGVIQQAIGRVDELSAADTAIRQSSLLAKPFVFFAHMDRGIAGATLSIYRPAVPTTVEGFVYAALGMILILAFYHLGIRRPIARHLRKRAACQNVPA